MNSRTRRGTYVYKSEMFKGHEFGFTGLMPLECVTEIRPSSLCFIQLPLQMSLTTVQNIPGKRWVSPPKRIVTHITEFNHCNWDNSEVYREKGVD